MKPLHIEDQRAIALALTVTPLDTLSWLLLALSIGFSAVAFVLWPWTPLSAGLATSMAVAALALRGARWWMVRRVDAMKDGETS